MTFCFLTSSCVTTLQKVTWPLSGLVVFRVATALLSFHYATSAFSPTGSFPVTFADAYPLRLLRASLLLPCTVFVSSLNSFQHPHGYSSGSIFSSVPNASTLKMQNPTSVLLPVSFTSGLLGPVVGMQSQVRIKLSLTSAIHSNLLSLGST